MFSATENGHPLPTRGDATGNFTILWHWKTRDSRLLCSTCYMVISLEVMMKLQNLHEQQKQCTATDLGKYNDSGCENANALNEIANNMNHCRADVDVG